MPRITTGATVFQTIFFLVTTPHNFLGFGINSDYRRVAHADAARTLVVGCPGRRIMKTDNTTTINSRGFDSLLTVHQDLRVLHSLRRPQRVRAKVSWRQKCANENQRPTIKIRTLQKPKSAAPDKSKGKAEAPANNPR